MAPWGTRMAAFMSFFSAHSNWGTLMRQELLRRQLWPSFYRRGLARQGPSAEGARRARAHHAPETEPYALPCHGAKGEGRHPKRRQALRALRHGDQWPHSAARTSPQAPSGGVERIRKIHQGKAKTLKTRPSGRPQLTQTSVHIDVERAKGLPSLCSGQAHLSTDQGQLLLPPPAFDFFLSTRRRVLIGILLGVEKLSSVLPHAMT